MPSRPKPAAPNATSERARDILARMRRARSVDEGDDLGDQLAALARRSPRTIAELYASEHQSRVLLAWCLRGSTHPAALAVLLDARRQPDAQLRWAAVEGLKHLTDPEWTPVFAEALADRYHLSKCVAVEWLAAHGDERAIGPLEKLVASATLQRTSPGLVTQARAALERLRAAPDE